jgi:hypothetical protein
MTSMYACPTFSLDALWEWGEEYSYILGMVFMLTGIFLALFGGHQYKATMFLAG